jgi:hypothetical protein
MAVSRLYSRKGAPLAFPQLPCLQIQGGPVHGGTVGVDHLDFYPLEVVSLRPLFPEAQRRIMQMTGRWAPEISGGLGSSRQPPHLDPPPTAAVVASVASGSTATCPSFSGSPLPWHVAAQTSASRHESVDGATLGGDSPPASDSEEEQAVGNRPERLYTESEARRRLRLRASSPSPPLPVGPSLPPSQTGKPLGIPARS